MEITDEVFKRIALELDQAEPIKSQIPCFEAFAVLSALQLSLRHPRLVLPVRAIVEKAARDLQAAIAVRSPLAGEVLEDGWNEALDVIKCGSERCAADAEVTVFWPSRTLPMCRPCAMRARGVADAMGFNLEVREGVGPAIGGSHG